jgi:hypothetical protein
VFLACRLMQCADTLGAYKAVVEAVTQRVADKVF